MGEPSSDHDQGLLFSLREVTIVIGTAGTLDAKGVVERGAPPKDGLQNLSLPRDMLMRSTKFTPRTLSERSFQDGKRCRYGHGSPFCLTLCPRGLRWPQL